MKRKGIVKRLLTASMTAALALTGLAVGGYQPETVLAADTDEIMLGTFWTSDEDVTDTLYWSTDGENFYELCEAYTDATPNDADKMLITNWAYEQGIYDKNFDVSTLHDPAILYKDGYFMMLSGYTDGSGDNEVFYPMIGYSSDLKNWSYPRATAVTLSEKPAGSEKYGDKWDMVAPDFMVDDDGTVYIVASFGYYASWHGDDPENDIMKPYLVKGTVNVPANASPTTNPDLACEASYEQAIPINLPCMTERPNVASDHIDGSLYKEGDYYYFSIKENGVTIEIWKIDDLSKVSDASAWELVSYDVISGYEGPCLTKFNGEYFMYVDRLATYTPMDTSAPYGTAGQWLVKASTGTTGVLDEYTGWLESNIKELKAYDLNDNRRATRHGSVITVTGEAARVVRELAREKGYDLSANKYKYNDADWAHDGWYYKESYRDWKLGGDIYKYYYQDDVRLGADPFNSEYFGLEMKDPDTGNWVFLEGKNDGKMATASNTYDANGNMVTDAYYNGNYQVYMPVDMELYNKVGKAAYGEDVTAWCIKEYDYFGTRQTTTGVPFTVNGKTGYSYHFDPETGAATIGRYDYVNDKGHTVTCYMDPKSARRIEDMSVTLNGKSLYFDENGSFIAGKSDKNATVNDVPTMTFAAPSGVTSDKCSVHKWNDGVVTKASTCKEEGNKTYTCTVCGETRTQAVPVLNEHNFEVQNGKNVCTICGLERTGSVVASTDDGWRIDTGGKAYWYEGGIRQGTYDDPKGVLGDGTVRGREIYDPVSDGWYWLDAVYDGAKAVNKEVWMPYIYQGEENWPAEEVAMNAANSGDMAEQVIREINNRTGKWVRYDANGKMYKGWYTVEGADAAIYPDQVGNTYYYDHKTGLMAKGWVEIDGQNYYFDEVTGVLQ